MGGSGLVPVPAPVVSGAMSVGTPMSGGSPAGKNSAVTASSRVGFLRSYFGACFSAWVMDSDLFCLLYRVLRFLLCISFGSSACRMVCFHKALSLVALVCVMVGIHLRLVEGVLRSFDVIITMEERVSISFCQ